MVDGAGAESSMQMGLRMLEDAQRKLETATMENTELKLRVKELELTVSSPG